MGFREAQGGEDSVFQAFCKSGSRCEMATSPSFSLLVILRSLWTESDGAEEAHGHIFEPARVITVQSGPELTMLEVGNGLFDSRGACAVLFCAYETNS